MGLRKHKASGQIAQRDIDQPALINEPDACATWSFLANFLNSRFKPFGFIAESSAAIKLFQRGVAREDIKSNAPLQLPQADWTKMQRTAIAFGEMI